MGKKCSKTYAVVNGEISELPEQVRANQDDTQPTEVATALKCSTQKNEHRKPGRPLGWQRGANNRQRCCRIA